MKNLSEITLEEESTLIEKLKGIKNYDEMIDAWNGRDIIPILMFKDLMCKYDTSLDVKELLTQLVDRYNISVATVLFTYMVNEIDSKFIQKPQSVELFTTREGKFFLEILVSTWSKVLNGLHLIIEENYEVTNDTINTETNKRLFKELLKVNGDNSIVDSSKIIEIVRERSPATYGDLKKIITGDKDDDEMKWFHEYDEEV